MAVELASIKLRSVRMISHCDGRNRWDARKTIAARYVPILFMGWRSAVLLQELPWLLALQPAHGQQIYHRTSILRVDSNFQLHVIEDARRQLHISQDTRILSQTCLNQGQNNEATKTVLRCFQPPRSPDLLKFIGSLCALEGATACLSLAPAQDT